MSNKSQRKKEQFTRRRNEKLKRQAAKKRLEERDQRAKARGGLLAGGSPGEIAVGSNLRHRERLAQQIPQAWPGELPADAAVFADEALASLPPDLVPQVTAVRTALAEALAFRGDEAQKSLAAIPRGSPLSEWRLFIRGLSAWLADDFAAADEAWRRLDLERRPGRIATSLMLALRTDLEQAAPRTQAAPPSAPEGDQLPVPPASPWDRFDATQLYHGKLLRRVRFDRAALRFAEAGLKTPEESSDLTIGLRKIHWLGQFIAEYGPTEPDLVAALAHAALRRACSQNYSNVFDEAVRKLPGPRHDRRHRLLTFFYYSRFADDASAEKRAERSLDEYLNRDLPQNAALSPALRGAIASQIHLNEALTLMTPARGGMFEFFFAAQEPPQEIRTHLLAAALAAPGHSAVYKAHVGWIDSQLENHRLKKPAQERLEKELAEVMRNWSLGAPDNVEPRLWLVDHLLENEQLEEARPHVDFLAASRQDDPLVRATPWKWQLLEAQRLCRRKAWLPEIPARLAEAEKLWPAWLSKQWLPYWKAAWQLRTGRLEAFEEERRSICAETGRARDSLADACLMLGAAQLMRATPADLKPLRAAADEALALCDTLPLADLIETASFFWDLHRARLLYPAYRLQGKTIGKELFARLEKNANLVLEQIDDVRTQHAVLWGAEYRYWSSNNETKFPACFKLPAIQKHPAFIAAQVHALLNQTYHWGIEKYRALGPLLKAAAASERDAYYRHWYADLAARLEDVSDKETKRFSGGFLENLFNMGGDDDDFDLDPNCDCDQCRARRAREQASRPGGKK